MPFALSVQLRDPSRTEGGQAAPLEGVSVAAGPPPADTDVQTGALDPDATLDLPVSEAGPGAFHVDVPDPGTVLVRLTRPGHAPIQVCLNLSGRTAAQRFPHRRPMIMRLARLGAETRDGERVQRFSLVVDLHAESQELAMASGHDGMFHPAAEWRLAWLVKKKTVHSSCLLTRYTYESKNGPELTVDTILVRTLDLRTAKEKGPRVKGALLTRKVVTEDADKSVLTFYEYIAQVGRERPGTLYEVGFLNHAYWMGPVLLQTSRQGYGCHWACPVQGGHHKNTLCELPKAVTEDRRWYGEYAPRPGKSMVRFGVLMRELSYESETTPRWTNWDAADPGHQRSFDRSHATRDASKLDRDARNTDFCHPRMLEQAGPSGAPAVVNIEDMQLALNDAATLRVWGCSNGTQGGLFREAYKESKKPPRRGQSEKNRVLRVSHWHGHDDEKEFNTWAVRQRDFELQYLSNLRRSYPQAIAVGLGKPCYGAIPGTWGWFADRALEGGLTVHKGVHRVISPLAKRIANIGEPSPGLYHRFEPDFHETQKTPVKITVLVTGFVPFRYPDEVAFPATNGAAEAVKGVREFDIEWGVDLPPWIDLDVELIKDPGVDVVWTCPAARSYHPPAGNAPNRPTYSLKGSRGILEKAQEVDADIVIVVGESAAMARKKNGKAQHARMELFARNVGQGYDPAVRMVDNDGYALDAEGELFPGAPAKLRTTVPLRGVALAQSALKNIKFVNPEEFRQRDPVTSAGDFVCNESYYRLLLEAQESGRWVSMVHVPATEYYTDAARTRKVVEEEVASFRQDVSYAVQTIARCFVEHMVWGTEVYGRLVGDDARARQAERRGGVTA